MRNLLEQQDRGARGAADASQSGIGGAHREGPTDSLRVRPKPPWQCATRLATGMSSTIYSSAVDRRATPASALVGFAARVTPRYIAHISSDRQARLVEPRIRHVRHVGVRSVRFRRRFDDGQPQMASGIVQAKILEGHANAWCEESSALRILHDERDMRQLRRGRQRHLSQLWHPRQELGRKLQGLYSRCAPAAHLAHFSRERPRRR